MPFWLQVACASVIALCLITVTVCVAQISKIRRSQRERNES